MKKSMLIPIMVLGILVTKAQNPKLNPNEQWFYSMDSATIEKAFITNISGSFEYPHIERTASALFICKCLGDSSELDSSALSTRILNLLENRSAKEAFFRRINYYLSSTMELYDYLSVHYTEIKWDGRDLGGVPPPPPPPTPPLYYVAKHILSFGEDTTLGKCDVRDIDKIVTATPAAFVAPEFPGGQDSLTRYLIKHTVYPQYDKSMMIQGKVLVKFTVCPDGSIGGVTVPKGISKALDAEAMRVVKMLPKFKPGTMLGIPVPVYFTLPVVFKLG